MAGWFSLTGWFWSLWAFLGWCVWLAKWTVLAATLFPEGPWYEKTEKQKTGNDMIATVDTLLGEIRAAWRKLTKADALELRAAFVAHLKNPEPCPPPLPEEDVARITPPQSTNPLPSLASTVLEVIIAGYYSIGDGDGGGRYRALAAALALHVAIVGHHALVSMTETNCRRRVKHCTDVVGTLVVYTIFYLPCFLYRDVAFAEPHRRGKFLCVTARLFISGFWSRSGPNGIVQVGWYLAAWAGPLWSFAMSYLLSMSKSCNPKCHVCEVHRYRKRMMRCETCGRIYCSKECAKKDRPNHACRRAKDHACRRAKAPARDEAGAERREERRKRGPKKDL